MQPPPPGRGAPPGNNRPLQGALILADFIRTEHGREGVKCFLAAINPLVPRAFLCELADLLCEPAPPPPPPPCAPVMPECDEKKPPPKSDPQELLFLMQALSGAKGGGLDPKLLMKLMQSKKD